MPTFAVVDIETTGGNFHSDRVIEVAVVLHDGANIIGEYSTLINPEKGIQPFISRLTGISNKMVRKAPTFSEVADELFEVLQGHVFVAHNVKFDYGFLKTAFKREGKNFRKPHFCTVELSRKVFPGHESYSLGKLCKSLGIHVEHRHRAFGDAAATAELLSMMMKANSEVVLNAAESDELERAHLPKQLNIDVLDALPEEAGVYFFYDEEGRLLYASKAKSIRQSAISHFRVPLEFQKDALTAFVSDVDYTITANDIISELIESKSILEHHPRFNKTVRKTTYRYGVCFAHDEQGYLFPRIAPLKEIEQPVFMRFSSLAKSEKVVQQSLQKAQIIPTLKQILPKEKYNPIVERAIMEQTYPHRRCCMMEAGRSESERVALWIDDFMCIGYSYFDASTQLSTDLEELYASKNPIDETPDLRRHILQYIRKKKNRIQVIPF